MLRIRMEEGTRKAWTRESRKSETTQSTTARREIITEPFDVDQPDKGRSVNRKLNSKHEKVPNKGTQSVQTHSVGTMAVMPQDTASITTDYPKGLFAGSNGDRSKAEMEVPTGIIMKMDVPTAGVEGPTGITREPARKGGTDIVHKEKVPRRWRCLCKHSKNQRRHYHKRCYQ